MTSFGIEWETNAVTLTLPPGKKEKRPIIEGNKWSVTFEGRWFYETRDGLKEEPKDSKDCMYGLEVQLGPFFSQNPKQFNLRDIMAGCSDFSRKVWSNIVKHKVIKVNERLYPVLSYRIGKTDEPRFIDCGLTEPGHLYNTKGAEWGYIASLDDIIGKTQYTIGIQLEHVVAVFRQYVALIRDCTLDKSKCETIVKGARLSHITKAYFDTYKQCREVKMPLDNHKLLGLIMLCNYTIATFSMKFGEYYKALYHVKPRSNFACIFERLLDEVEKELFIQWAEYYLDSVNDTTTADKIQSWIQEIVIPVHQGYTIVDKSGEISSLEIITSPNEGITKQGTKAPYALLPGFKPVIIDQRNDTLIVTQRGQDVQEWATGPKGEVYLEFRAPETVISLLDKKIHQEYLIRSGREAAGSYNQTRLAIITQQFVQVFLNGMFADVTEIEGD